jgi:hypothetical protein
MVPNFVASHLDSRPDSPQESREPYWINSPVQRDIRQILSTDMSSTTIKSCRIAWALDSDSEKQGIRSIVSASGVTNMTVQKLLPAEGEQDALGLIRCVSQGQGGVDPLAVRRSRYVAISNGSDPSRFHHITHMADPVSPAHTVFPGPEGLNSDQHTDYVMKTTGVPSIVSREEQALLPGHDVWSSKNMGDLGWALAVVYGPVNIGHFHENGPTLSLADLRRLTGKTQKNVWATLAKWDKAENCVPFKKIETPGMPTTLFIMFKYLVGGDNLYLREDRANRLMVMHAAESVLHKQRTTALGVRAWVLATDRTWMWKDETPPVIPAEVVGEQATYEYLVALEEAEKAAKEAEVLPLPLRTKEQSQALQDAQDIFRAMVQDNRSEVITRLLAVA